MNLQEWERDVINRQRNIVFPDTMLNEGRFYRNIASGKAVFTSGQRISLVVILCYFIFIAALDFTARFGQFLGQVHTRFEAWILSPLLLSSVWLLFWIFLAVKVLFLVPESRKRRRGYRRSSNR